MKKIVKYINLFVNETIFVLRNKTNYFFKKKIAETRVNIFNKVLVGFILLLFLYLFYLLIPTLYNKSWVQKTIENKLIEEFKIDFSLSSDITYGILPSPHFLIKDSKIFIDNNKEKSELSEIKRLKVFIEQNNFLDKKKININYVVISDTNFLLNKKNLILLNKFSHNKFSNKRIEINNGNVFIKNNKNEITSITKIKTASLFYDNLKMQNSFSTDGEIFNIPFNFHFNRDHPSSDTRKINFKAKKLKLNILDKLKIQPDGTISGLSTISFFNKNIVTKYSVNKNLASFELDSPKIKNSNINFKGMLSFRPFEFKLDVDLKKYDLFKLLNFNSFIIELFNSKILFNENLSTDISINIIANNNNRIFSSSIINFNIANAKINFDKTKFTNNKIGILEIENSNLFFKDGNLILNSNALIDIKNSNNLFVFLQTPKKFRKPLKSILINFDYDFSAKQLIIKKLKIDKNENNNEMIDVIKEVNNIEKYNLNKTKRMFNKLLSSYSG